jgi:hypothetical protein
MIKINKKLKSIEDVRTEVSSGIQMTFENGNTISIQFGYGNYCENKHESKESCKDAEIAMWNEKNVWHDFGSDCVKGYCTMDEVADYINYAKNNVW